MKLIRQVKLAQNAELREFSIIPDVNKSSVYMV